VCVLWMPIVSHLYCSMLCSKLSFLVIHKLCDVGLDPNIVSQLPTLVVNRSYGQIVDERIPILRCVQRDEFILIIA